MRFSAEFTAIGIENRLDPLISDALPLEATIWIADTAQAGPVRTPYTIYAETFEIQPLTAYAYGVESVAAEMLQRFNVAVEVTPEDIFRPGDVYPDGWPLVYHELEYGFAVRAQDSFKSTIFLDRLAFESLSESIAPVPLPAGAVLLLTALGGLVFASRSHARISR
ncbi:VPLPA-CTERM sorting domain-containing protein [Pacificoceanicola onchidii]|uniref:VPLPA-CTERM sorting domain-containing protein n=1 Tax=Pacificoceanicola onchidii TaxID=2562685 RepID=UPI001455E196|nr:VPLPA-CTERM sorting domain-containing protein [Pacificoceanicola onchidii]